MTQSNEQPESDAPDDAPLSKWESFICKVQKVARAKLGKSRHGIAAITVKMIVDRDGEPIVWLEPDCWRIEPSADVAKVLLEHMIES